MKKLLSLVTVAIACLQALAIPAHPGTTAMPQPDGTMITIELHGDEYYCFTTCSKTSKVPMNMPAAAATSL